MCSVESTINAKTSLVLTLCKHGRVAHDRSSSRLVKKYEGESEGSNFGGKITGVRNKWGSIQIYKTG